MEVFHTANLVGVSLKFENVELDDVGKRKSYVLKTPTSTFPLLETKNGNVAESRAIEIYLCTKYKPKLLGNESFKKAKVNQWIEFASCEINACVKSIIYPMFGWKPYCKEEEKSANDKLRGYVKLLDNELKKNSFIVGNEITLADVVLFRYMRNFMMFHFPEGMRKSLLPNLTKWFEKIMSTKEATQAYGRTILCKSPLKPFTGEIKRDFEKNNQTQKEGKREEKGEQETKTENKKEVIKEIKKETVEDKKKDSESVFDVLPGAEKGKVVTRFAPEPSGYLHIGHVKAVMISYYAAKHFQGQMILRFDDTNPSKEKEEFLENIIADLKKLGIVADKTSYSSDYFPQLRELMTSLIKEGKAYCDNIDPEKMKKDRMDGVKSEKRDTSVEENLKIWKEMQGENPSEEIKKYCIRGKIDYQNANKCLRDPVFYRFTEEKHARYPENYHLFPCYDFSCPCIDSIEGVTHAMRANEYSDRIPMYEWVQDSLKLRKVTIYEFSRMNLIQTVLSKRYLKWFVETGRVEGWDDPRFPTVQGIIRRGLVPEALKDFCLEQGASKKGNLMEWDKIYAINRNYIDPIAKRYFAVSVEGAVNLVIDNIEDKVEEVEVDWHQKNKELGKRNQNRYNKLVIEKEDANLLKEGQKLTLYKWGNSIVEKIEKEGDKIILIHVKLTPEDKDFKKTTICHWIPMKEGLYTKAVIREYGHLITVKKFEDNMKIEDIVNNNSKFETTVYIEKIIEEAKVGDKIQLERRGYCVVDSVATGDKLIQLNFIPDGKTKSQSIIAGKVDAKTVNKGDTNEKAESKKAKKKAEREAKKAKKEEKKAQKANENE